jgi:hypothetical protein
MFALLVHAHAHARGTGHSVYIHVADKFGVVLQLANDFNIVKENE